MTDFIFLSEKGKRDKQEDFYANLAGEFFVVADGLGGHPAGEVAAKTAIDAAISSYRAIRPLSNRADLGKVFKEADRAVYEKAQERPEWAGMGTTMVVLLLKGEKLYFASVGDSRGYVLAEEGLVQITEDDREGRSLTQALGLGDQVSLGIYEVDKKEIGFVLLCTDGLTDFVKDQAIEKILCSNKSLKKKAEGLIKVALENGSTDNITVGLIEL